jgi:hypothetical protein
MDRKRIFDAVRRLLGRGFQADEIVTLDTAIDQAVGVSVTPLETIGRAGIALIKRFEGCRLTAYPDPGTGGDPWTIGWGATGKGIRKGTIWTQQQADARLENDLTRYAAEVAKALQNPDYSGAVRRAGQLPLQHGRNRQGDADPIAQGWGLRWRACGVRSLGLRSGAGFARARQTSFGRGGPLQRSVIPAVFGPHTVPAEGVDAGE